MCKKREYLNRHFVNFIEERSLEIRNYYASSNSEYMHLENKLKELQCEILEALPQESKHLVLEFESVGTQQELMIQNVLYKYGFVDFPRVLTFLDSLGKEK